MSQILSKCYLNFVLLCKMSTRPGCGLFAPHPIESLKIFPLEYWRIIYWFKQKMNINQQTTWNWDPLKYNTESKKWEYKRPHMDSVNISSLSLVTFNIWFDEYYKLERLSETMSLCKGKDIICFQEVTQPKVLQAILGTSWVQNEYYISDVQGNTVSPYGVLILSKIPLLKFSFHKMHTNMERFFLCMHLILNNELVQIGTVHLESLNNQKLRKSQLITISKVLTAKTNIFCGDFNFCSYRNWNINDKDLENKVLEEIVPEYIDVWEKYGNGKGYTFDSEVNKMLEHHEQMRYDRIMIKSKEWKTKEIHIIGNQQFAKTQKNQPLFPSDHFGLSLNLEYKP